MDFKKDLTINPYNLEEECVSQPSLYMDYVLLFAQAVSARDKAKLNLEVVEAETARNVRENPEKYGVIEGARGYTEAGYSSAVSVSKEVQEATLGLIDAQEQVEIFKGAKEAMLDKSRQLTNLTHLYYYINPGKAAETESKAIQEKGLSENDRLKNR
jgi:hypothetical protein